MPTGLSQSCEQFKDHENLATIFNEALHFSQEASTTPVFGSASTFGTADKGFGGFSGTAGAAAPSTADTAADNDQTGASPCHPD